MRLLRSVAAVVVGYMVFAVSAGLLFGLTGVNPHAPQSVPIMAGTVVYGIVFAVLAGLVAVRLAPGRPALHAALVSAVIALGAGASLIASPPAEARWSQWTALLLMAPAASLAVLITSSRRR